MNTQEHGMTNAEYNKAIADICACGRGYEALADILRIETDEAFGRFCDNISRILADYEVVGDE